MGYSLGPLLNDSIIFAEREQDEFHSHNKGFRKISQTRSQQLTRSCAEPLKQSQHLTKFSGRKSWRWRYKLFNLPCDKTLVIWSNIHKALKVGASHGKSAHCLVW